MPYQWSDSSENPSARSLHLWPYRSLPRRGFAAFILGTFALITVPLSALLGTILLWGILPFMLLALAGLWWGLERSYRSAEMHEELTIDADRVHLLRVNPDGSRQDWECNSYWARVRMHPRGGPVEHYITLKGAGREVEIGAFLSEDERKVLYGELFDALRAVGPH